MKISKSFQYDSIQGFKFGSWPFGRPKLYSHVYFIDGLLIDTGHRNMRKAVLSALSPLSVDQIYITHHHEDHTGNLGPLQQVFNAPTYASSLCVEIMKKPPSVSFSQWLVWGKNTPNFKIQAEDQKIETPNYQFTIIPIPGHAVDMVCLYEPNQGWLFSADLFTKEYIRYFLWSENMIGQIESIQRILKLDFEVLLCSHNPQFEGAKEKLKAKLDFLTDFYGSVAGLYHKGYSSTAILKAMNLKENWLIRILSTGALSTLNMIEAVIRDEEKKK